MPRISEKMRLLRKILTSEAFFLYFSVFFWLSLLFILFVKLYLILPLSLDNDNFLYYYKFLTPDSYDWIINAKYFEDLESTSIRQPGFTLIVKFFLDLNSLWLVPVLNQLIFVGILFSIYDIAIRLTNTKLGTRYLVLFFIFILFQNNYLQIFSNLFLSDLYAIFFYSTSLALLLRGHLKFSAILLGLSWLTQNFAPVILPIFLLYIFFCNNKKNKFDKPFFENLKSLLAYILLFLLPNLPWFMLKLVLFGNPFYTHLGQLDLISPNGNSFFYYFVNGTSIFGILFVPIVFISMIKILESKSKIKVFFLSTLLLTSLSFWVVLYEWNDRRFLLYLMPTIAPLLFKMIYDLKIKTITKYFVILFFFVNTTVYVSPEKLETTLPLTHWESIEVSYPSINLQGAHEIKPTIIRQNPPIESLIFPNLYFTFIDRSFLRNDPNSLFARYRRYIENNYNGETKTLCYDPTRFSYNTYEFKNILRYIKGDKLERIKKTNECMLNL